MPPKLLSAGPTPTFGGRFDPVTVVCADALLSSYLVSSVLVVTDEDAWITVPTETLLGIDTDMVLKPLPEGNAETDPNDHVTSLVVGLYVPPSEAETKFTCDERVVDNDAIEAVTLPKLL